MALRWGLGPVFAFEGCLIARRWQVYAGRVVLVAGLMVAMAVIWLSRASTEFQSIADLAQVGRSFFSAMINTELVLVLLVAPAAAAGAICQEKARGGLTIVMVTDLSNAEIVLGKLAARLVTVVSIILCALPVLALATFLGGVDPWAIACGTFVVLGVAVLGVSVALGYSLWANRPQEALMATYATWAVWLLFALVFEHTAWQFGFAGSPNWVLASNPFWLLYNELDSPRPGVFEECVGFFLGCLAVSAVVAIVTTGMVRKITLRRASRSARKVSIRVRPAPKWLRWLGMPEPTLDDHPIFWREWHRRRPSAWSRIIWRLYAVLATACTLLALIAPDLAAGTNGFTIAIAMLILSASSATVLAEERVQASLDVLMASPLLTREIVLGKWWGAFRPVPRLAILPAILDLGVGLRRSPAMSEPKALVAVLAAGLLLFLGSWLLGWRFHLTGRKSRISWRLLAVFCMFAALTLTDWRLVPGALTALLSAALVLIYGAAVVSLGLAAATWQRRLDRAVALSVSVYLAVTVFWPAVIIAWGRESGPVNLGMLTASPFFGLYVLTAWLCWPGNIIPFGEDALLFMGALVLVVAVGLRWTTLASFDLCLGRISEQSRSRPDRTAVLSRRWEALVDR